MSNVPNLLAAVALALAPVPALAGDAAPVQSEPVVTAPANPGPGLMFSLYGGVSVAPAYFGADETETGPALALRFHGLRLGSGRSFGSGDPWEPALGLGVRPALRFIAERDASAHDDLSGMADIDATVELGLGLGYTARNFAVFAEARRGFGGHEDWVGELGADLVARPVDGLRVTFGPRVFWGGDAYAATYFGVTAAEASALNPAFDARGGVLSAGLELGATYALNDTWGIDATLAWSRWRNDAADSPIVKNGREDDLRLSVGLVHVFRFGSY